MKRFTKRRRNREEQEQTMFFDYCRLRSQQADAKPHYDLVYAIPNERKASVARHIALRRAGLKKGIPDICVPIPNDKYSSLYIEMKVKPNRATPEQMTLLKKLNGVGHYAVICWSGEDAINILENYIANKL